MFLGVNSVTRGLESASVGFVLLAQDADPKILISHIPTMCAMQGVPILIMPSLRSVVSTALGFSCIALGVKVRSHGHTVGSSHDVS
jgi:ribosomal protein L7Ae-like RNA K-turn-binding protein